MNILIENGTVLPMNLNGDNLYFKANVGIEGEKIAFVSDEKSANCEFLSRHKDDCRRIDASGMIVIRHWETVLPFI